MELRYADLTPKGAGVPTRHAETFLRISRWDGAAWTDLGEDISFTSLDAVGLATSSDGETFLSWPTETDLVLRAWDGTDWIEREPTDELLSTLPAPSALDTMSDDGLAQDVHLRRFEHGCWRGLSASDQGGGVSNSSAASRAPRIATHGDRLCIAYTERGQSEDRALIRCHDESLAPGQGSGPRRPGPPRPRRRRCTGAPGTAQQMFRWLAGVRRW